MLAGPRRSLGSDLRARAALAGPGGGEARGRGEKGLTGAPQRRARAGTRPGGHALRVVGLSLLLADPAAAQDSPVAAQNGSEAVGERDQAFHGSAQPNQDSPEPDGALAVSWMPPRLSADPNEAVFGFEYRGAVRGRFGDAFVLVGDWLEPGYSFAVLPLIELHEPRSSANVLPSQYWRARISFEQGYGWSRRNRHARIALALTHESDHETAHPYARPGFLALNDIDLRFFLAGHNARWAWTLGLDAILYGLSCTEPSRQRCENFRGDTSYGGQAQAGAAWTEQTWWIFSPFASAAASGILPRGLVEAESRLSVRLGLYTWLNRSMLALFALGWFGHDVGIVRARTLNVIGGGVSFAR